MSINPKKKLDDLLSACNNNLSKFDPNLIEKAFHFSFNAHKNDVRASGEQYFLHPYNVAMLVAKEIAFDDVSVAAALLHDIVEDTEITLEDIKKEFGTTISEIVNGLTKISDIFKSREVRQAANYSKLLLSMVSDIRVMIIKIADRLHNMRTLEFLSSEKQNRVATETLELYAPFAHKFGLAKIKWEMEDLAFKYLNKSEYEKLQNDLKEKSKERDHYIKKFNQPIIKKLEEENIKYELEFRPKNLYSIYKKLINQNKNLDSIYDIYATRIILNSDDNNLCFSIYGIVTEIYKPIPERFKDFISLPKKNGYQSLHTTVIGPKGKKVEVQIRTRKMHEIAERGIAAHWLYKDQANILDKEMLNWVNWVREIFESKNETTSNELFESIKLNLYQDEIYIFTPKGDLKILPRGSTPLDFAFEVHSDIGIHTIGAKVNSRMVPLNTILKSGDQIEILTSKKQIPNVDWENFVVTHKAKNNIRKWIRENENTQLILGKEIWEKKIKKSKINYSANDLDKIISSFGIANINDFYVKITKEELTADEVIDLLQNKKSVKKESKEKTIIDKLSDTTRKIKESINIFSSKGSFEYSFAKCCQPIPGDAIIGFVTTLSGIKIHQVNCKNVLMLKDKNDDRLININWPTTAEASFIAGIKIRGFDRPGILNEITNIITVQENANIYSINTKTNAEEFDGTISFFVKNTEHLKNIILKIKNIKSIDLVERLSDVRL